VSASSRFPSSNGIVVMSDPEAKNLPLFLIPRIAEQKRHTQEPCHEEEDPGGP
jgi:hypothetical protein